MLFNSLHFAAFFILVYVIIVPLQRRVRARNAVLLIASYYFYGYWDWRFLSLLMLSTGVDYLCGRLLDRGEIDPLNPPVRPGRDRLILGINIALNLGLLGFFKYYNFFVHSAVTALASMGIHAHPLTLHVILPVGISFYTFQSISYTIDVYRGDVRAERSLLNYAAYIAFFPQLVAGPIERGANLIPQFRTPNVITWEGVYRGFYLMCWGLFKKVVIADNAALVADAMFSVRAPGAAGAMVGIYAFAIQIYCDFSGYSDVARGAARVMGFHLMENFDLPYLATNPSDFWRRWHISLSTWLRDYLYIPLGGSRKGTFRTYVNLMATMVLGGLWHGAAWTFVLWGAFHGTLLCVHRAVRPWMERHINPKGLWSGRAWYAVRVAVFFHLVCFGWLLFRSESTARVARMLRAIARGLPPRGLRPELLWTLAGCAAVVLIAELVQFWFKDKEVIFRVPVPMRATIYAVGILVFVLLGNYGGQSFIYFQF